MTQDERVKFCDACDAVISWHDRACSHCGSAVRKSRGEDQPPAEAESDEVRLFKTQLRLSVRTREEIDGLAKKLQALDRTIGRLEASPRAARTGRELRQASALLVELEEGWSEIQRGYNRQSEAVEEEFLEKIAAGDVELELSADRSAQLEEAVQALFRGLEAVEKRLRETGSWLDLVMARHRSGLLGVGTGARGTLILGSIALLLGLGGAAWGAFGAKIRHLDLLFTVGPAWLGLVLMFVNSRAKSL